MSVPAEVGGGKTTLELLLSPTTLFVLQWNQGFGRRGAGLAGGPIELMIGHPGT